MTADPRASLATLVTALERHLEVASSRRDPDDPSVMAAAQELATAFDDYDEALFQATEVATPLAIYDGPFDEEDDDDAEDGRPGGVGADPGVYSGLEDDDLDYGDEGSPAATAVAATAVGAEGDDDDEDDEDEDDDLDDEFDDDDEDEDEDDEFDDDDDDDDDEDDEDEAEVSPLVAR